MASISYLGYFGPHEPFYRQAVRSMSLAETDELKISRIKALRSVVTSPLIRSLLKSTRLAF